MGGSAIIALIEGGTDRGRQRRSENRRRWKRGRRRPEWQGLVPAEQPGIIRAGKWAESHAVLANRPGATDDKPDGWRRTVSTLLWERGRRKGGEGGGGWWKKKGAAGGWRGSRIARDAEDTKGENVVVMSTESKCLPQVHDWHGWDEFTGRRLGGRAALQVETSLLVELNPPQPGYRPLNHRPRLHICRSEPIGGINVGSEHFCWNKLTSRALGTKPLGSGKDVWA